MNKPEMILFDWGQTLERLGDYDAVKGTAAMLEYAIDAHGHTAEEIQSFADGLISDAGISFGYNQDCSNIEIHEFMFNHYLFDYFDIEFTKSPAELEWLFWTAADGFAPADGIEELLSYLKEKGVRMGVVSNISFSGKALERRIRQDLPFAEFEFIIPSSEYIFRKPHRRIFELAAQKAKLPPEKIWFCGDNVICDVKGSHDAGFYPVWYKKYCRGEQSSPDFPHAEIDSWDELRSLIEAL